MSVAHFPILTEYYLYLFSESIFLQKYFLVTHCCELIAAVHISLHALIWHRDRTNYGSELNRDRVLSFRNKSHQ